MSYTDDSFNGDEIVDRFHDYTTNIWTPPTPVGFYCYHLLGASFDRLDDELEQISLDNFILSARTQTLDKYYGKLYNIPRKEGWDDTVYSRVLYVNSMETLTVYQLKKCLSSVFECEYDELVILKIESTAFRYSDETEDFDTVVDDFSENETDKSFTDKLNPSQENVEITFPKEYDKIVGDGLLSTLIAPYLGFGNITLKGV